MRAGRYQKGEIPCISCATTIMAVKPERQAEDMERLDKAERDRFATEQEEPITEPEE